MLIDDKIIFKFNKDNGYIKVLVSKNFKPLYNSVFPCLIEDKEFFDWLGPVMTELVYKVLETNNKD